MSDVVVVVVTALTPSWKHLTLLARFDTAAIPAAAAAAAVVVVVATDAQEIASKEKAHATTHPQVCADHCFSISTLHGSTQTPRPRSSLTF